MDAWISTGDLPDTDLAVLVAGEDFPTANYDGFDQATVGFETGEFLMAFPDADVLAVGASVEKVP